MDLLVLPTGVTEIAGGENAIYHLNSALLAQILILGMVVGMGMRFPKSCFALLHTPPSGRRLKFKMAAIRLYSNLLGVQKITQY